MVKRAIQSSEQNAGILVRDADLTLVDQLANWISSRIEEGALRTGARVGSIRDMAARHGVSRFTVVEAYDRLVALGYLEARHGAGFYVRKPAQAVPSTAKPKPVAGSQVDIAWLLHNLIRDTPSAQQPGSGLLPARWLGTDLITASLRSVSRMNAASLLRYGSPRGYAPLRRQLQLKLGEISVAAKPEQIVLTSGVTHAINLVARQLLRPGDTVFIDDPAWFMIFGSFAALGARIVGVPWLADGPDVARLEVLAQRYRPKFYVVNSVLHNPTGTSIAVTKAHRVLQIAEEHGFYIVENDVYADLDPEHTARIASLDQLRRVIYVSSFAKTLAANLRVGFLACDAGLAEALTDQKMLSGLTTAEIGERVVHHILSEGHYRKHVARLRKRLDAAYEPALRKLEAIGLRVPDQWGHGPFIWADAGMDTIRVAAAGLERGYVFAPGSLFSPSQSPSTWLRFNIATSGDAGVIRFLEGLLSRR